MARTILRRRADGLLQVVRVERWRWVWIVVGALCVVPPLILSMAYVLPPVVLALPPMALWVAIWRVFRRLDAPPAPRRAPRPPGPSAVIPLRRAQSR